MPDIDYDPVEAPDDEEERRRQGEYPPASPARTFDVGAQPASAPPSAPGPSSDASMAVAAPGAIAKRSDFPAMPAPVAPAVTQPRPQWSDYAPAEPHGWAKFGHTMAAFNPITNKVFNEMPEKKAQEKYKNDTAEYEAPINDAQKEALTDETKARAEALKNPQPKEGLTPEETTLHDLMTGENGAPRQNPQTGKPYTYMEAYQAIKQAAIEGKPAQAPHITYDQGIPVSVTDGKKTYDINDPKLPPDLKPLVDSANRAHSQHSQETIDQQARASAAADERQRKGFDEKNTEASNKRFETALDADTRLSRMEASYAKGLKGDQQAMLALLTDHIGMTLGMQKGARITKDILNEATQSQPWLAKIGSKFDDRGYLSGVTLGPDQMKQMLDLGYEARDRAVQGAHDAATMYGVNPPKGAETVFGKRKIGDKPALQQSNQGGGAQEGEKPVYHQGKLVGYTKDGKTMRPAQ
jgi:hypothetical protein